MSDDDDDNNANNDADRPRAKKARLLLVNNNISPPPPSDSSPTTLLDVNNLDAIIVVEQFLSIEDTINLSKTCHAIRNILVHNPNGVFPKIKVSHFEVVADDDAADAAPSAADDIAATTTPHRRINNFTSNVLANIHFPALERLEINFPTGKVHRLSDWEDELRDSFIYLTLGLERAVNLEELILDFTPFLMEKSTFLSQNNYNTLSANLCRCIKLKRLEIINRLEEKGGTSVYGTAFLAALIPAIERGVSTLESLSFVFGEDPITLSGRSSFYTTRSSSVDNDTIRRSSSDLFRKILLCNKLKELGLNFSGREVMMQSSLLNSFLRVSRDIHSEMEGKLPSSSIEKLTVTCVDEEGEGSGGEGGGGIKLNIKSTPDQLLIAPFMDMILKQPNLVTSTVSLDGC